MLDNTMLFTLLLSVLMLLFLNWVYFFDWMRLIGWLASLMSPDKTVKEIEDERKLRQDVRLKKHLRKWKLRFLIVPISFTAIYSVLSILTEQLLLAYLGSLIAAVIAYGVVSKYETTERNCVINKIKGGQA